MRKSKTKRERKKERISKKNDQVQKHQKNITKTHLYNFDPLKPHFYIVKLGFTGGIPYFPYFSSKT